MRILLVEAHAATAAWARRAFDRRGDAVFHATPATASARLGAGPAFDLVVLACDPPGCDGPAAVRALRGPAGCTPILVVSAHAREADTAAALDAGADDAMGPPLSEVLLHARARAAERRGAAPDAGGLAFGDLILDPVSRRARGALGEALLTAREYTLLAYLMRHPGRTVTRARLLEHVWGYAFDPGTNVVEVALSRLRRKLAGVTPHAVLRTVRGLGVSLDSAEPAADTSALDGSAPDGSAPDGSAPGVTKREPPADARRHS